MEETTAIKQRNETISILLRLLDEHKEKFILTITDEGNITLKTRE